jgi:hypothetical protein
MVKPIVFQCDDCEKIFQSRAVLNRHIWGHLKILCICRICLKRFSSKQSVFNHVKKTHHNYAKWIPKWHCGICCSTINDIGINSHVRNCLTRKRNGNNHMHLENLNDEVDAIPVEQDNLGTAGNQEPSGFNIVIPLVFLIGILVILFVLIELIYYVRDLILFPSSFVFFSV